MRKVRKDYWSDDSEHDETARLNPEAHRRISLEDGDRELASFYLQNAMTSKPCGNFEAKITNARITKRNDGGKNYVKLDYFTVAVLVLVVSGTALILPGISMRMDTLPVPFPFVALPLVACDSMKSSTDSTDADGLYTIVGTQCPSLLENDGRWGVPRSNDLKRELKIELHKEFLLYGVHYVPRIAFPQHLTLTGALTFELLRGDELVATSTLAFSAFKADRLYKIGNKGAKFPVYLPEGPDGTSRSEVGDGSMCSSPEGCIYELKRPFVEATATRGAFWISPEKDHVEKIYPVRNLNLVLRDTHIRSVSSEYVELGSIPEPPIILLSFHQSHLTDRQAKGVSMVIGGIAILFIGLSLLCLPATRNKKKQS